jgi:O-antigen ligase
VPQEEGALHSLGLFLLLVFLFLSYSRLLDLLLSSVRIALITSVLVFTVVLMTGGLQRALFSRAGVALSLFTAWLLLAVPFSYWPGGSVQLITDQWSKSFFEFIIIVGILRSLKECRLALYAVAAATIAIEVMCLLMGNTVLYGRLTVDVGVLGNPNDLAQLLLMGLPFIMLMAVTETTGPLLRAFAVLSVFGALIYASRTGSRSGMVCFVFLVLFVIVSSSWKNKMKVLGGLALCGVLVLPLISSEQRSRYLTLFQDESQEGLGTNELSAIDSKETRRQLLQAGIDLTLDHPLVGVGPGVFEAAEAAFAQQTGQRGQWHETHNTYTQVSTEAGIPGFVLYVAVLVISLRITRSVYKAARSRGLTEAAHMAYCLALSLIVFAVTGFFASVAYLTYLPMLAGLCTALELAVEAEEKRPPSGAAALGPVPQFAGIRSGSRVSVRA